MEFDMRGVAFMLCVLAVTAYLAVASWEDYKTCEITRWKHLIGGIPAICLSVLMIYYNTIMDYAIILAFMTLFIIIGIIGVYGMADGFILANLTLFFGSICGVIGIGVVILIAIIAAFSFLSCHIIQSTVKQEKIFRNISGALAPHLLIGYVIVWFGLLVYVVI